MRVVFVADLHVHGYRMESRDNGQDRLVDGLSALRQTLEFAREYGCPWIFGGDIKLPRRSWPHDALTGVLHVLREYGDVRKLLVAGNHDGQGEYGSGLSPFRDVANTQVVDEPSLVLISDGREQTAVAVWPAMSDPKWVVAEWVRSVPDDIDVLVGHGFVAGAKLGPDDYRGDGSIPLEAIGICGGASRFRVNLFGDVHKGQMFVRSSLRAPDWVPFAASAHLVRDGVQVIRAPQAWRGEIVYAGSPYMQNWGEREDGPKGALLVDLASGQVDLLHVEAPRYVLEEWPDRPARVEFVGSTVRWRGNFVRVVAGPWAGETGEDRSRLLEMAEAADPRSFALDVVAPRQVEQRAEIHSAMGKRDICEAYVAARPLASVEAAHVVAAGEALWADE